jgi:4-amino-4-deoxy-L-arabinose transferase-like glycosyltransferase
MAVMRMESAGSTACSSYAAGWWMPRLAGPLITAVVVRLMLLAVTLARNGIRPLINPDTTSYLEPGRNLLLHGRFVADGVPDLLRTPGYPLFLAATSLAGLPAAALANVILSVFIVFLVWKLGRAVFDDGRIALGAAWICAFEPIAVVNSAVLISETLFLALFLLSMERLAAFLRGRSLRVLAAAGLLLAAATFVRPVTYYLPVALALGLFLALARVPGLRWKAPAVLLISVLSWLAAWQFRNWVETGYAGFSSVSDVNLYFFIAPDVAARVEHRSYVDMRDELGYPDFRKLWLLNSGQIYLPQPYLARNSEQAGWSQGRRLSFMHSEALRVIRTHYGAYLRSCPTTLFGTLFELGEGSLNLLLNPDAPAHTLGLREDQDLAGQAIALIRTDPWIAAEKAAFAILMLGLYLFAARGVFLAARGAFRADMHGACLWLLLGTSLYFLAVTAAMGGPVGSARYRLPIMPAVCILAAAGFRRARALAR